MRLLLVTPPMIQLNTPYPATAYLMGFLRLHAADLGLELTQADASLTLFLRLFSAPLIARTANVLRRRARTAGKRASVPPGIAHFLKHAERYVDTVGPFGSCNAVIRAWHFGSSGAGFCLKGHASST